MGSIVFRSMAKSEKYFGLDEEVGKVITEFHNITAHNLQK